MTKIEQCREEPQMRKFKKDQFVDFRDAFGNWQGPIAALSDKRVDWPNAFRGAHYLSVSIQPEGWEHPINWPAEDIRPHKEQA